MEVLPHNSYSLILAGPPGAGKSTLGRRLCARLGLPHLSSGALLRSEIERETPVGIRAREFIEHGRLAPFDLVAELFRTPGVLPATGFLLDGFPRTLPEALFFEQLLSARSLVVERVVLLTLPQDVALGRLRARDRECKSDTTRDDNLGSPVVAELPTRRMDDDPAAAMTRFAEYAEKTVPMLDYYRRCGILFEFDATASTVEVEDSVLRALSSIR